ncbi:hypothetical protein MA16_Dca023769 [Dendrobium catenatum]|uniref:Uncharacterized protein n=1 Tax=Dendrobium catenatum TaxID=906689 RepID=A0A2I0X1D2_9ASPA|nr:hypothetical protein MA16_Dca023769 [Dendrobium catenatum]
MRVLKWTPFFDIKEESPIVPIWISFPNLRLHFFNSTVLHALGSIFGRPLQTDQATASRTRPSVARVLVEVDISLTHPKEVWVGSKAYGYLQKAEFEKIPEFCSHCKMHGHAKMDCFKLHPDLKRTGNYVKSRPASAEKAEINEMPTENGTEDILAIPVEPPQMDPNYQLNQDGGNCEIDREIIESQENLALKNSNKEILSKEASSETEASSSSSKEPKIFILVNELLNEMPVNSNSVAIENDLLLNQENRVELHSGGMYAGSVEEGEFFPPSFNEGAGKSKKDILVTSPNMKEKNVTEDDWILKGGKKKGKQGKNFSPANTRSTRAQASAKYGNV